MQGVLATSKKIPSPTLSGRQIPQALDLEESVLGALLIQTDAITEVVDLLSVESFYHPAHQDIYGAVLKLFSASSPIDLRTVVNQLKKEGKLEKVGGASYIARLTHQVASAAHIVAHAHILVEYAIRRSLIDVAGQVHKNAFDEAVDTFELLDKAEQSFFTIAEHNIRKSYKGIDDLLREALKEIQSRKDHQGVIGVPTGFVGLDRLISGCQKSDLILMAARPGMGKTSLGISVALNAAVQHKKAVAFFSLEMSAVQVTNRMLCSEVGLESSKIKKGNLKDYEWEQLFYKSNQLSEAPIYIDDTAALSLFELRSKCRRLKAKHQVELIVVDYLQLMTADISKKGAMRNREQEVATISAGLKSIAKELDIPIIAMSQLSRSVEIRGGDKRPILSDLRESGAIEQDADIVLFLYRPEYYGITEDESGHNTQGLAEIIVAKHRNGALGKVNVCYQAAFTKFLDFEQGSQEGKGYF